jgi:ATP/maltotriose-dependent transcriptional regulator MalT
VGDLHTELPARRAAAQALASTGEPDRAREHLSAAFAHAEKLREPWWLASTSYDLELLALYEGDWDRARDMSDFGLRTQRRDCRHLALRAILEFGTGNVDTGTAYIARLQELAASVPPPGPIGDHVFLTATVALASSAADLETGLDAAKSSANSVLSLPRVVPVLAMITRRALAMIAVQEGDPEAAERRYRHVESGRGSASMFIPLTVDRVLGQLAVTAGHTEAGIAHFEEGLAFCERAGYRPEHAWTASDYAEALLARGGPDDRARAIALQDVALATARELGMRPLLERVLANREMLSA